ncbi:zinc finger FYVE domain-containing protein 16 isoform X2 [Latimeria chalumnae]|uniref:zinc finger FYVE domain-containing protein 16 isoform X2 n=1 Tax=Latimeria chalumnae TaxID=7897 RepID=UPI00313B9AA0
MESYFKAAVCDLDKLLDDFEQNTDELDCYRSTVESTVSSNYPPVPSDFHCLEHEHPGPNAQPPLSSFYCATPEMEFTSAAASAPAHDTDSSEVDFVRTDKQLTGVDLLSTLDASASAEMESSVPGRSSVPVCDLISDMGSLVPGTESPDDAGEFQPAHSESSGNLIDFALPTLLDVGAALSTVCGQFSETQEYDDGELTSESAGHLAVHGLNLLDLDASLYSNGNDSGIEAESNDLQEMDHKQLQKSFNESCPRVESPSTENSKEYDLRENCLHAPEANTNNHAVTKKAVHVKSTEEAGKMPGNVSLVLVPSALSETSECNKNKVNSGLGGHKKHDAETVLDDQLELIKKPTEGETVSSFEHENSETFEPHVPTAPKADVQSSLSCLPIAVSTCSTLVVPKDSKNVSQGEVVDDVVNDPVTLSGKIDKSALHGTKSHDKTGTIDEEDTSRFLDDDSHNSPVDDRGSMIEKSGKDTKVISKLEALQHQAIPSFPFTIEQDIEPAIGTNDLCDSSNINSVESLSSLGPADLKLSPNYDEDLELSDSLITDAELDAFLMRQNVAHTDDKGVANSVANGFLQHNLFETGLKEVDVSLDYQDLVNVGANKVLEDGELTVKDETEKGRMITDVTPSQTENVVDSSAVSASDGVSVMVDPMTNINRHNTVPAMGVDHTAAAGPGNHYAHFGGARPKQLFNLPRTVCDSELKVSERSNCKAVPANTAEGQMLNCMHPTTPPHENIENSLDQNRCDNNGTDNKMAGATTAGDSQSINSLEKVAVDEKIMREASSLGLKQPSWVPDSEAPNCMNCQAKFTFTKRRHHCRACGKVFCAVCCNRKCKLQYLEKEARVCVVCYETISKGVLPREQKRVWFADGILPNGEVADTAKLAAGGKRTSQDLSPVSPISQELQMAQDGNLADDTNCSAAVKPAHSPANDIPVNGKDPVSSSSSADLKPPVAGPSDYRMLCTIDKCVSKATSLLPDEEDGLPPVVIAVGEHGRDPLIEERPSHGQIMLLLEEGGPNPLTFVLNANLLVNVKLVTYSSRKCWCFTTNGLHGLGQAEIVVLLLFASNECTVPKDLFRLFINIYQDAQQGKHIKHLGSITFTESFLGSKDHGGFLFVSPSFQALDDLPVPNSPFLFGILIQKPEVPWAKVFSIRLMLRLGVEYNTYPCPVVSIRQRKSLFGETGHTIMNLLADLRNYQYTLPNIEGLVIHMEMGKSYINLPKRNYSAIMKLINSSNEHVISMGASFSSEVDSHLVCVQNDEGTYQTQACSVTGKTRKVTGASFVVFNGALKTSSGFLAKSSIVEDGLMVQITTETMENLRQALRERKDFQIACGKVDAGDSREYVNVCWIDAGVPVNKGIKSPVDGRSLEGIPSVSIVQETEFETDGKLIRCSEVLYHLKDQELLSPCVQAAHMQFAKEIATACSAALCPHLRTLKESGLNKLGLRVSIDTDMVEYQAGSGGHLLPQNYLNDLDSALIPVIHGGSSDTSNLPIEMEFIFFIIENLF